MSSARRLRGVAVLIATAALSAACGGGSSSSTAAGSASTAPQTGSIAGSSTPTASSSQKAVSGGSSGGSFCQLAKAEQKQESAEAKALTTDSPQQLEQYESNALAQLSKYTTSAPSAIRADVETVVAAVQALFKQLKAANYDYTKLSPSALSAADSPAFTKASTAVDTYLAKTCGITEPAAPTQPTSGG